MAIERADRWMPLHWGPYLRKTMHLKAEGHGAYLLLIGAYWMSGEPLPDDDEYLSAVSRLDAKAWKRLRGVLARFFNVGNGVWQHDRIDLEIAKAKGISEKRQTAGKEGGKAAANAKQLLKQSSEQTGEQNPTPLPLPSPLPVDNPSYPSGTPSPEEPMLGLPVLPEGFEPDPRCPVDGAVKRAKRAIPLPDDWELPNDWRDSGVQTRQREGLSVINLDLEAQRFKYHHLAKGSLFKNWKAAWLNWITSNFAGGGGAGIKADDGPQKIDVNAIVAKVEARENERKRRDGITDRPDAQGVSQTIGHR